MDSIDPLVPSSPQLPDTPQPQPSKMRNLLARLVGTKKEAFLPVVIFVVLLIVAIVIFFSSNGNSTPPEQRGIESHLQ